jgi:peptidoglycan hydrolase CwlO-like protein
MSRPFLTYFVINTFTTVLMTTFYNFYLRKTSKQDEKLEFLLSKIKHLEQSIDSLQQSIEDIEENINKKNSRVIESNMALSTKLDDFINYSYDVYE